MVNSILWAFILSILPGFESRVGILALYYNVQSLTAIFWIYFFILVILNSLMVFPVMFFLEFLHHHFLEWGMYRKTFGRFVESKKKTADKVQAKMHNIGYIALALFVAIPFTGTGVYTGSIVAWMLGLSKRKTFLSVLAGVFIAAMIMLVGMFLIKSSLS